MDLFITVHDSEKDIDTLVNMSTVESFVSRDIKDRQGQVHLCILYIFRNGIRTIEEFDTTQARQDKMNELEEYMS